MILVCPNCSARFKVNPEALGERGRAVKCAKCGHQWRATRDELVDPAAPVAAAIAERAARPAPADAGPPSPGPEPEPAPAPRPARAVEQESRPLTAEPPEDEPPPPPPPMTARGTDETEPPPIPPESEFVPRRVVPERKRSPLGAWIALGVFVVAVAAVSFTFRTAIVEAYPPANRIFQMAGFPVDMLGHGLTIHQPRAEAVIEDGGRRLVISGEIENGTGEAIDIPLLAGGLTDAGGEMLQLWTFEAARDQALPGERVSYRTEVVDPPRGATNISITFITPEEAEALGAARAVDGVVNAPAN